MHPTEPCLFLARAKPLRRPFPRPADVVPSIRPHLPALCGAIASLCLQPHAARAQAMGTAAYVPVTYVSSYTNVTPVQVGSKTFYHASFLNHGGPSTLTFYPSDGGNWQTATAYLIDVKSNMDAAIPLTFRILDRSGFEVDATVSLAPRQEKTVSLPFAALNPNAYGLYAAPWLAYYPAANAQQVAQNFLLPAGQTWRAPGSVASVIMSTSPTGSSTNLSFGQPQIQVGGAFANVYTGLIDSFGQSTQGRWPGKAATVSDLQSAQTTETAQLRQWTADRSDVDAFGGLNARPLPNNSGYFRTLYQNGRWWLVSPAGHAFFQLGVDLLDVEDGYTITSGRDSMFRDLPNQQALFPNQQTPVAAQPGVKYFNFYGANLEREYGSGTDASTGLPDYLDGFKKRATWRLQAWRFNTVGWLSNDEFARHPTLPFTFGLRVKRYYSGAFVPGPDGHLGYMPDPFDPAFQSAVTTMVNGIPSYLIKQNFLVGYFFDNEFPWGYDRSTDYRQVYSIPVNTLALAYAGSPAKREFFNELYRKYGTAGALAQAWGVSLSSWNDLKSPLTVLPASANAAMTTDLQVFLRRFANQYFKTVQDTLKAYDPNHLLLGCRFANNEKPLQVLQACAAYCDVVSVNVYDYAASAAQRGVIAALNAPVLVSEFHNGSADRGPFWPGLIDAGSEDNRGSVYAGFVNSYAALPNVVGLDWYKYVDQPASGEISDMENGHIGLVSVTDSPYAVFLAAVRQVNLGAAQVHAGTAAP